MARAPRTSTSSGLTSVKAGTVNFNDGAKSRSVKATAIVAVKSQAGAMPAGLPRIRKNMKVQPTAKDKGLELTLKVIAYDNGKVAVDGVLMTTREAGWIDASENVLTILNEFRRQADKREKQRTQ